MPKVPVPAKLDGFLAWSLRLVRLVRHEMTKWRNRYPLAQSTRSTTHPARILGRSLPRMDLTARGTAASRQPPLILFQSRPHSFSSQEDTRGKVRPAAWTSIDRPGTGPGVPPRAMPNKLSRRRQIPSAGGAWWPTMPCKPRSPGWRDGP